MNLVEIEWSETFKKHLAKQGDTIAWWSFKKQCWIGGDEELKI